MIGEIDRPADRSPALMLLGVYSIEREHQYVLLQLITTILTIVVTYVAATVGLTVHACHSFQAFSNTGCKSIPTWVVWLAPGPGYALVAFFSAARAILNMSFWLSSSLEQEIADHVSRLGIDQRLVSPMTLYLQRKPPSSHLPDLAFGATYAFAGVYAVLADIFVASWHSPRLIAGSVISCAIYLSLLAWCARSRRRAVATIRETLAPPDVEDESGPGEDDPALDTATQ